MRNSDTGIKIPNIKVSDANTIGQAAAMLMSLTLFAIALLVTQTAVAAQPYHAFGPVKAQLFML